MNFYLLKNIDLLKMGGGVVFAYYHIQSEMVVDMYGGFGFLRSLLKEYDFLFYVLDAKTVDERPPPEELVDGRAILDKRLYMLPHRRYDRIRLRCFFSRSSPPR